jgi:hypothetical protein
MLCPDTRRVDKPSLSLLQLTLERVGTFFSAYSMHARFRWFGTVCCDIQTAKEISTESIRTRTQAGGSVCVLGYLWLLRKLGTPIIMADALLRAQT